MEAGKNKLVWSGEKLFSLEIHRELGQTPRQAQQQARAEKRSRSASGPALSWWPYVWRQQTRVRVGDDGQVPVGAQRQPIEAPPRSTVIRCLRPDGDIYYLRHAPPEAGFIVRVIFVPSSAGNTAPACSSA